MSSGRSDFGDFARPPFEPSTRHYGTRTFDFARQVAVMGIVDVTPNSFHRPGTTYDVSDAVRAVEAAAADGADWIDIGGVAYAPGPHVSARTELERVLPVVAAAKQRTDLVVSLDTDNAEVAAHAAANGVDVINDASGLRDPEMAAAVAESGAGLIITHSGLGPRVPSYREWHDDVVAAVIGFLEDRVAAALDAGVAPDRIIVDPGVDLHKNTYHSLILVRRMSEISALGFPVLAALSNKDFIGEALGGVPSDQRLAGTMAANVVSVLGGARLLRVHEVAENVRCIRTLETILDMRPPDIALHNLV